MEFRYFRALRIGMKTEGILQIGTDKDALLEIATDINENPVIPGSSIAGAIKAYFKRNTEAENLLSYLGNNEQKSKVYFYDAQVEEYKFERRDGICQDRVYGGAEDKKKYTGTYISEGATFNLIIESFCQSSTEDSEVKELFELIVKGIRHKHITFGGKKTNGAGICKIQTDSNGRECIDVIEWDLSNEKDMINYLKGPNKRKQFFERCDIKECDSNAPDGFIDFKLTANINNALLVKGMIISEKINETDKDAVNITYNMKSKDQYIIPASTMKGALRAFSEKLINLFELDEQCEINIFGDRSALTKEEKEKNCGQVLSTDTKDEKEKKRGRVFSTDVKITSENNAKDSYYNRIKIDRWLGGTMNGSKFTEKPICGENVEIKFKYLLLGEGEEKTDRLAISLIYLFLRELGTGNIAIGSEVSVGYGRFTGEKIEIYGIMDSEKRLHNIVMEFSKTGNKVKISLKPEDRALLTEYLKVLQEQEEICN
ncbi:hypothetical protein EHE19_008695 [Ruminiclostridium herbifermentans]|uniref:CRISPR type III-associated protein domain-containing protein n=1 Tax=Ruminiclostridium herbifermentans TaxID=2488810 RepID=A0A4U7JJA8_9FIRM|nr:RAMP superfamily CRISPR-associated protein [Ruminiclostridium herbifermentans]QNU68458.1 hypothetical protein EHE19_008695 [Ruminiclostridium herbifermentans]